MPLIGLRRGQERWTLGVTGVAKRKSHLQLFACLRWGRKKGRRETEKRKRSLTNTRVNIV